MKKLFVGSILLTIGVAIAGSTMYGMVQEPYEHMVELGFDWDAGHTVVASTETITVAHNLITLEMRDEDGITVIKESKSVPDCMVAYNVADPPAGDCGSTLRFTITLPYRGYWEEWVRGEFVAENSSSYTYTVPGVPSYDTDDAGFTLIGILQGEWYDICPADPPIPTLYPTQMPYPIQATYTPAPTPTCKPTATPLPPQPTYTTIPLPTLYPTSTPYPIQP